MKLTNTIIAAFACITSVSLVCIASQSGENPGLKVRINSAGLELLKNVALEFVEKRLNSLSLPNFSGSSPFNYEVKNLRVTSFNLGTTSFQTASPNIFKPKFDNARVSVTADWSASKRINLGFLSFTLGDSGSISASASDVDIIQSIILGRDGSSKPTFSVQSCSGRVGSLSARVHGSSSDFLLNLAIAIFRDQIHRELEGEMCPAVRGVLIKEANKITREFNVNFPFVLQTNLNLGLVCNPQTTGTGILVSLRGRCFPRNNPSILFPFVAPTTPALSATSQMARISVSPYLLNTLLYSIWQNNLLQKTFSSEEFTSILGQPLTTLYLAAFIPTLAQYGDSPLEVVIAASEAPVSQFTFAGIGITGCFELIINTALESESNQRILTVNADVIILAQARIENNRISGTIEALNVTANEVSGLPAFFINSIIQAFLPKAILPAINGITEAGFEIPSYFNYDFENASVQTKQNAVEIGTNFKRSKSR